ncbi:MAG TPA: BTAD domain-containing putative transcriptional regulator [Pilimelia sp.]|nr:BTAD domain-containing putative transcriptional regulator [Pilimelia sp.]
MRFQLLGPVEMWHGDGHVDLGHAKQRCVLAVLLMEAGQVVQVATLIDRVWGHSPPDSALNVLYGYVARLRRALGAEGAQLRRRSGGYLLDVDRGLVDVHRFRAMVAEAGAANDVRRAAGLLTEALATWRGTPFAGLSGSWIATMRAVLEDQRLSAIIARNNLFLRIGRPAEVVSQLLELVTVHPGDERLVAQLMLAMWRSGRPSDALAQYRLARERLRDQHGADPGPLLRDLQQRILREANATSPVPSVA